MNEFSDRELFSRIKAGDKSVFKKLFELYHVDLHRFCLSMVRMETISEEIVQDAFVYLWEKRDTIQIKSSIKSYLFTTVKNKSINYIKNELPKQQLSENLSAASLFINEDKTEDDLLKIRVQKAIDQLPSKCRQIFVLSRYSGYTYREISEELDISIKTVENQMSIAFQKLRLLLPK
ncbi:MAG: RNA polymerase sigma-70 factor (ECF subfamily) [Cyclobacteriaceae bacterium]|jgi:RNA polymerase sigma-70 factor (ECF subfamily)